MKKIDRRWTSGRVNELTRISLGLKLKKTGSDISDNQFDLHRGRQERTVRVLELEEGIPPTLSRCHWKKCLIGSLGFHGSVTFREIPGEVEFFQWQHFV